MSRLQHPPGGRWPRLAILPLLAVLGACAHLPDPPSLSSLPRLRPYTLNIQQGVVVDQKMISRLSAGMTRNQVGLALGTPLLTDILHPDRWDYVYYTRVDGEVGEWRRFTCEFKDDRLVAVTGDVTLASATATAPAGAASITAPAGAPSTTVPTPSAAPVPGNPGTGVPAPAPDAGPTRP